MFTGLVQAIGTITALTSRAHSRQIGVTSDLAFDEGELGESIAIDGACFTVTRKSGSVLFFDVSHESLARTTIGSLKRGDRVHLERALRFSDRLGGHLVLGHVDGVGTIRHRRQESECWFMEFAAPKEITEVLISKGSIAINGVSLTVNAFTSDGFSLMIVPHTAKRTLLTTLPVGSKVNLETDVIGKYVSRLLGRGQGDEGDRRLEKLLEEQGFM